LLAGSQRPKRRNGLTLVLILPPAPRSFGDCGMTYKRALNLHGCDPMTSNADHVINASHDPQVTVFVTPGAIAGEIHTWYFTPVLFLVSLGIAVDRAQHRRPRAFDHQKPALICADRFSLAVDDINHYTRQRSGCRTGFGRERAGNRRNHDGSRFRLPPRIDNGTTVTSDIFVIPHPGFRVDRLTNG